jgi:hypothetical protein
MEGVMMRGARTWAVAVRTPDGDVARLDPGDRHGELALLTGYSSSAICRFELGTVPASQTMGEHPVTVKAWRRYKMICCAVDMLLRAGKKIEDWEW